jgi:uncharacterized protein (TIGR04255 family)
VEETAFGIQFSELTDFTASHFGLYWERIRQRYPVAEDQQRLNRMVEYFPPRPSMPHFSFRTQAAPERVWFRNAPDGEQLVQVQPDRFGFNWRQGAAEDEYPTYDTTSRRCLDEFAGFADFCREQGLGELQPNICELVYVNRIEPQDEEHIVELFDRVFEGIDWRTSDGWLPVPERVSFNRTYEIPEQKGRLYADASVVERREGGPFIRLRMMARILHHSEDQLSDNLRLAHDWIVNGFVSLTNEAVRRDRWGQL